MITSDLIRNENGEYVQESIKVSDSQSIFNHLRSDNAPYLWLRKDDFPFELVPKEKVQLDIFNELNNSILLIRIQNQTDLKNDLFYIYFNKDLSNFGTIGSNKILSTENKTIIGYLLRNTILTIIQNSINDKELFATLNENTRAMIKERNVLKEALAIMEQKYKDGLIQLSNSYLNDLSNSNSIVYHLSEGAIKKLMEFKGDISKLKQVIIQAAGYAESMNLEGRNDAITIADFHLVMDEAKESKPLKQREPAESPGDIPVKYNKTFLLLDKLENAAMHVKSKNMLLTGANVGNEFSTPVTPPAITDALKKHKQKILFLFGEYPNRWGIIRSEFRPIQNILNARAYNEQRTA